MVPVICAVNGVVRAHCEAVGACKDPFTPRAEEISFTVEYDDGMVPSAENIHLILSVHPYRCDLSIGPPVRQLPPSFDDLIKELPASHDGAHSTLSVSWLTHVCHL